MLAGNTDRLADELAASLEDAVGCLATTRPVQRVLSQLCTS